MINLKRIDAPQSTITYDKNKIDAQTGNIYEAISIIAKRASQINAEIKHELEEVFENKEQIEVSKFYEKLPKPQAIAVKEWLDGEIYYRYTDEKNNHEYSSLA